MIIYAKTEREKEYCNQLAECLKNFTLFSFESDKLLCHADNEGIRLSYWTKDRQSTAKQTTTDIQIALATPWIGYVNYLEIEYTMKRKGHGRYLYNSIESFFQLNNCTHIRLADSGEGRKFWKRLGFSPYNAFEVEKILKQKQS